MSFFLARTPDLWLARVARTMQKLTDHDCGPRFCTAPTGPLQNVWHTCLTDPRQFGILQTRSWLTGAMQSGLLKRREFIMMSSTQPGRTDETRRHLHYVLRMGNPEPSTPMLDSVERWNWAVRISVVGLFVVALVVIAFRMASVVVPL